MNAETYAVVSYEEMIEAKNKSEEARKEFRDKYKNFLITCLCKAGLANALVCVKKTRAVGVLRVEERSYASFSPYEIKFYPIKKNGEISKKSQYVAQFNQFHENNLVKELLNSFEPSVSANEN